MKLPYIVQLSMTLEGSWVAPPGRAHRSYHQKQQAGNTLDLAALYDEAEWSNGPLSVHTLTE